MKIIYQDNIDLTGIKPEKVRRFIDINIVTDTFTLTIENEIDTGEHSLQCVAYRNFMLNSSAYNDKGQDHYFVLLAKDKPDDFDKGTNETTGRYPGYVYMDYNMIRKILVEDDKVKNSFSSESGQDKAVAQYAQMIDEWTNLNPDLVKICKKIRNFEPFAEKKQYDELMKSEELTEAEKRFADVARRYYLKQKKKYDAKIKTALEAISRDQYYIKDDYGRGGYAIAIPLKFENLDVAKYLASGAEGIDTDLRLTEEEYKNYQYLLSKDKKDLKKDEKDLKQEAEKKVKNAKDKYCKEKSIPQKNPVMNTVDYRAPMAGYNKPNIAFICGLNTGGSTQLCKQLTESTDSLKKLAEMKKSPDWDITFTYYFGSGAGYTGGNRGKHCFADLSAVGDNTELLKKTISECFTSMIF